MEGTTRYEVYLESFVLEVGEDTSEEGVREAAYYRMQEELPYIKSIEEMEA